MKSLAGAVPGTLMSALPVPSSFRIAVPSWRAVGITAGAPRDEAAPALSREEIQALFRGELAARVRRKSALTEREEQEKWLARRIRSALYPQPPATLVQH